MAGAVDPENKMEPTAALSLSSPSSSSPSPFWQDGDAEISGKCDLALEPWVVPPIPAVDATSNEDGTGNLANSGNGRRSGGDGVAAGGLASGEGGVEAEEGAFDSSSPTSIQVSRSLNRREREGAAASTGTQFLLF